MTTRDVASDPALAVRQARGAYLAALHGPAPKPSTLAALAEALALAEREHAEAVDGGGTAENGAHA